MGNAVWRNRAKRRMREMCLTLGGPFSGYDVAFVAKRDTVSCDFSKSVENMRKCLCRAGIEI